MCQWQLPQVVMKAPLYSKGPSVAKYKDEGVHDREKREDKGRDQRI